MQYQLSLDGGNTYGGTVTPTATQAIVTNVTVTFAGTFTLNDTYSFSCTDVLVAAFVDSSGNVHGVVDHNGFVKGSDITKENWRVTMAASGTVGPVQVANYGQVEYGNSATSTVQIGTGLSANYGFPSAKIVTGTTNSGIAQIRLPGGFNAAANTSMVAALEFDVLIPGSPTASYFLGFIDNTAALNGAYVQITPGGLFYIVENASSSTSSGNSTASAAPNGFLARYRIELCYSATIYGTCARFFQNEKLTWVAATNVPNGNVNLVPYFFSQSAGTSEAWYLGEIRAYYNRGA